MKDLYAFHKANKGDSVKDMTIVVRGDRNATFDQIYRVMKAAREAGFTNVQLRAYRPKESN